PAAIEKIALYSTGIPRLINVICDNALLIAYAQSQRQVSAAMIDEVAEELRLGSLSNQEIQPRALAKPVEEQGTGKSAPELIDIKHRPLTIYEKPKDESLLNDSDDFSLIRKDTGTFSATLNRQEALKRSKALITRQWFRPTIGASVA